MKRLECLVKEVIDIGNEMERILDGREWVKHQLSLEFDPEIISRLEKIITNAEERYTLLKNNLIKILVSIQQQSNILSKKSI